MRRIICNINKSNKPNRTEQKCLIKGKNLLKNENFLFVPNRVHSIKIDQEKTKQNKIEDFFCSSCCSV